MGSTEVIREDDTRGVMACPCMIADQAYVFPLSEDQRLERCVGHRPDCCLGPTILNVTDVSSPLPRATRVALLPSGHAHYRGTRHGKALKGLRGKGRKHAGFKLRQHGQADHTQVQRLAQRRAPT